MAARHKSMLVLYGKIMPEHTCILADNEVAKLLEPIADHGHFYGFIANSMIESEKTARRANCPVCLREKEKKA